jgi:hypothetical protein
MKIEDPLPDFLTTLCTPSKEFENDSVSKFDFYVSLGHSVTDQSR